MIGDELMKPLGIETAHVAHHVDPTMRLQVAARMEMAHHHLLLGRNGLELDHRHVAALREGSGLVET